ncbi:MAG: transglycosylase domain-containing protein, partial [Deltaproteobacteria bacterium]|nr:transglycosylase domain-containing protein [Deltaproteobacteria bacterium]
MGAVKRVFAILGLLLLLCPGTAVQAQEKIATYPPFVPGYISIKVFDSHDRFVGRLLPEKRYWAPIDQIPIFLQKALVAIEDARFYEHMGIDLRG